MNLNLTRVEHVNYHELELVWNSLLGKRIREEEKRGGGGRKRGAGTLPFSSPFPFALATEAMFSIEQRT